MDLTPAFLDRWREHRDLDYLDRVREIFDQAGFDEPWIVQAQLRALVLEARATLRLSGVEAEEEAVRAVLGRGESGSVPAEAAAAVRAYADAHMEALRAASRGDAVTPALLDDLHARLTGGTAASPADASTDARLAELCDWLAEPPDELHPVVTAALAHLELLRLRRRPDGNGRLARLALLLLLNRDGYDYRRLHAPSTHWSDPHQRPAEPPAPELQPEKAETHPAVEHVVHRLSLSLRDTVAWVRAEESAGSIQAMAFGWPLQP